MERFLTLRSKFIEIADLEKYKRLRVQLHGAGILQRDEVFGSDLKTKKQQVVRTGDFIVAEIDAKVGGFGLVPESLNGGVVSSHYFIFDVDEQVCLRSWLEVVIRSGRIEEQVMARGSTNYAAVRPSAVLGLEIPLPEDVRTQHKLVQAVREVDDVVRLHQETGQELRAVQKAVVAKAIGNLL